MCPRGLTMQGVDKGFHKGVQAGHNLREDRGHDLTFLKQLRFAYGVSGIHGSAPSGAHMCVSRPQKRFIHKGLDHVNEAKTVEHREYHASSAPSLTAVCQPRAPARVLPPPVVWLPPSSLAPPTPASPRFPPGRGE